MNLTRRQGIAATIVLACVNVALIACLVSLLRTQGGSGTENASDDTLFDVSDFEHISKSSDINSGKGFVLYTNYACPYCAELHRQMERSFAFGYTTRLHFLDKGGSFSTQEVVSAYMLKLSKEHPEAFKGMESTLFEYQADWTVLSEDDVLTWMNMHTGLAWSKADIEDEAQMLVRANEEAPNDLEHVPTLYSQGMRYDGFVLDLIDQDAFVEGAMAA
ncbi:thioredoxin domain-containing protein [uncultured Slackia sp.]|uniref:thioredoxin domain-containing protein n=1 Tax=uncultured Slackia sp. TaxID=665903 RepID=UPI0025ECA931|nr:thioredoxin domain-containing protein [uncultured Slackia sp.]